MIEGFFIGKVIIVKDNWTLKQVEKQIEKLHTFLQEKGWVDNFKAEKIKSSITSELYVDTSYELGWQSASYQDDQWHIDLTLYQEYICEMDSSIAKEMMDLFNYPIDFTITGGCKYKFSCSCCNETMSFVGIAFYIPKKSKKGGK
jgi:hypothetical protein